jgi:hypothetical protein
LGVLASAAGEGPEYLLRLRILFLGAAALGCLGPTVFVLRKAKGARRAFCLPLPVLAARIAYVPSLQGALLLAGWTERLGRALGAERPGPVVHYALGCFVAALVCFSALVLVAAASAPRKGASIAVFVLFAAAGALALSSPDDRVLLPHAFVAEDLQPAAEGEDYLDVAEDGKRPARTRLLAALYGIADALSPRSGWAGAVREELHARFRAAPDQSLRARVTSIEGALRTARPLFRTSPRTPPA